MDATSESAEKLRKRLTDAHSIEEQALVQMRRAPELAGEELARDFVEHLKETEDHERRVRERLEALDAEPEAIKDLAGKAGGVGMSWFAKLQPDTPVKLAAHAYSYEHLEVAAYELLRAAAELAGDQETAETAKLIGEQERQMAHRLEQRFPDAVEATVGERDVAELADQLDGYLSDAHAVEKQGLRMLADGSKLLDDPDLRELFDGHREESERHCERIEEVLDRRKASSSRLKDTALQLGALQIGAFFGVQPDTDSKLAGFTFAFEHLEIALYSMLADVARRAGDGEAAEAALEICAEEREAASRIGAALGDVLARERSSVV